MDGMGPWVYGTKKGSELLVVYKWLLIEKLKFISQDAQTSWPVVKSKREDPRLWKILTNYQNESREI